MSVDAPLSFGQLYSWREVATYPDAWLQEANLPTAWDLRGLELGRVKAALRLLIDRHEPLRTTYHLRDGEPVQRVHSSVTPPIEHIDRMVTDRGDPDRTKDALVAQPLSMTDELGWRGQLITTGGAPMFLALSFSHLIVDVWSIHKLQDQFRTLVSNLDDRAPRAPSPSELGRRQRGESWRTRRDGAVRYWQRILGEDLMHQFPTAPSGAHRPRIQATLHSHRLGGLATQAAMRHGVTAPAVLLALLAAGLSKHIDADRVTMSLMSSNRFDPEHQHTIGTLNQLIPVAAPVDHGASIAEHIRHLHWLTTRAYRHSCYDVDRVTELAAEAAAATGQEPGHGCWFNHVFRCWYNYLQLDRKPSDPKDRTPAELIWTPRARQYGQPFDVRVSVRHGRTAVALRVDPEIIPADGVTDILRTVALGTQLAVSDPECSLKDLWSTGPRRLPRSLWP